MSSPPSGAGPRRRGGPERRPQAPLPAALREIAAQRLRALYDRAREGAVTLPAPEALPGDVERVWGCSAFVAQSCTRDPAMLAELLESGALAARDPENLHRRRLEALLADAGDEASLMRALRCARRREMVRIAWRDIGGCADFEESVRDASRFADAAIDAALARLHAWQCAELGEPHDADGNALALAVLALGKLGAEELNFSSDIDLLLAFPESGSTRGGPRTLSNEEFFLRLGRRLIRVLERSTEEGFVFRVDMRLRPFGPSGPLVSSFNALEDYYQIHGRDWERYALVRVRPVAGDRVAGERLLERLRPFVYRRYLDFGALESLRDMKRLITREVRRRGLEDDVKLGPGGIREVEFVVQAFQLARGGRDPELRDHRLLPVLERLGERGYLPRYAVAELAGAYRFLRTVEHRLQQADDRQTHRLPTDPPARERLAAGMRFADWDGLSRALEGHRARVEAQFEQVFAAPQAETEAEVHPGSLEGLWESQLDDDQAVEILHEAGFTDTVDAWTALDKLRESHSVRTLGKRGRGRLRRLVPLLLAAAAQRQNPTRALQRVFVVVESIAKRSVYLALLVERPLALSQLVRLCDASPWIARQLARYPVLLDELLDPRTLYAPLEHTALQSELDDRLARVAPGDTEQETDILRQFVGANVLRVAAADVSKALPLMVVSDHLTAIAEVALARVLEFAWRDLVARHGTPRCTVNGERREAGFVIVGYGKLGGIELGYGSDLDLVFLHGSAGAKQQTDGERAVDNAVFFGRLGQRIIHYLTARTPAGILYEVDPRLRPSGASGLLVSSLEAFERYQREEAWTWEHQALVRVRPVAGTPELGDRFRAIRRNELLRAREPEALRREVREMRDRMRANLGTRHGGRFDLKQDPGGIADIEFMVQYGVLRWARELGDHLEFTDNIRLLEGFAKARLLAAKDTATLADAYRAYRARVHELALQEQPALVDEQEFRDLRGEVERIWRTVMES